MKQRKIILASTSPRRKMLMEQIGLKFEIKESNYEEDMTIMDDPYKLVKFLALNKAQEVANRSKDAVVIGADTFIVYKNKFIGKPKSKIEAFNVLKSFSGREHSVVTGYAIIDTKSNKIINKYKEAKIKFRKMSDKEIKDYIKEENVLDKAGAYAIQEKGGKFIQEIHGDYNTIVGLPICELYKDLQKMGIVK